MPWWYYDKKELRNTPSIKEGLEYEVECFNRKEGARFIIETGNKMDLGYNTMATGVVYFHRFYMVHSFGLFPKYLTACCALFLAGKVEETPKKAKDIIKMAEKNLPPEEFAKFGADPKEELLVLERILLQSIKFDLQVDHPYAFLLKYAKSLKGLVCVSTALVFYYANVLGATSERQKMQDVLQMAWTFVNDSLCTTLCLQWEPEVIAVAMLYLAAKLSKYDINNWVGKTAKQTRWWEMFVNGVTLELLEDICHQVLDLYSQKRPSNANSSMSSSLSLPGGISQHSLTLPSSVSSNNNLVMSKSTVSGSKPMPVQSVPHSSSDTIPPLPANSVLPVVSNPLPNINSITSIYPSSTVSAPPPPPVYSVPPPGLPMNPSGHDGGTTGMYPGAAQYNAIPTHYSGAGNQYASYSQYGSNY